MCLDFILSLSIAPIEDHKDAAPTDAPVFYYNPITLMQTG